MRLILALASRNISKKLPVRALDKASSIKRKALPASSGSKIFYESRPPRKGLAFRLAIHVSTQPLCNSISFTRRINHTRNCSCNEGHGTRKRNENPHISRKSSNIATLQWPSKSGPENIRNSAKSQTRSSLRKKYGQTCPPHCRCTGIISKVDRAW